MALTVPVLMRLMSDGFILLYRFAPAFEAYLTPTSFLVLSGEPLADVNYAGILDGLDAEERLRRIGDIVKERDLPFILFLVSEVAAELAPIAHELGLENVGSMPFMTYEPDAPPAPPERYAIEQVRSGKALKEANDVL
ncbi:MAG TPA: hypothetical protein VF221_01450, partial [Chloroflexota bacterium]